MAKLREAASLEKHVLLKKLKNALEASRGRVAGKNKDYVEEAIAMLLQEVTVNLRHENTVCNITRNITGFVSFNKASPGPGPHQLQQLKWDDNKDSSCKFYMYDWSSLLDF